MTATTSERTFGTNVIQWVLNLAQDMLKAEAAKLRETAGQLALRSMTVEYHADPVRYEETKRATERLQSEALVTEGRAHGFKVFSERLTAPESKELSISDFLLLFSDLGDTLEKEFREQAQRVALTAAGFSPMHPEYGSNRAAAWFAYGSTTVIPECLRLSVEALKEAQRADKA